MYVLCSCNPFKSETFTYHNFPSSNCRHLRLATLIRLIAIAQAPLALMMKFAAVVALLPYVR